jgi:hypothetical protein
MLQCLRLCCAVVCCATFSGLFNCDTQRITGDPQRLGSEKAGEDVHRPPRKRGFSGERRSTCSLLKRVYRTDTGKTLVILQVLRKHLETA